MNVPLFLSDQLFSYFYFFGWHDIVEIFFFSMLSYYFFLWLKADTQKNLFPLFFYYWILAIGASFFELHTLYLFLVCGAPVIALLFITIHQSTLQRNYVTLMNITPGQEPLPQQWLDIAFRAFLYGINKGKDIRCLIEQRNSIRSLVDIPITVTSALQLDLLIMLIDTPTFDDSAYIMVTHTGKLMGVNAKIQPVAQNTDFITEPPLTQPAWEQESSVLTAKTDALVLYGSAHTRTFTLVTQGKTVHNLDAKNALNIIKKYIVLHEHTGVVEKKDVYGTERIKKESTQQFVS